MTVVERDGVGLVEPTQEDIDHVKAAEGRGDFEPDPGDPIGDLIKVPIHRLLVVDTATGERLGLVSWHPEMYGPTIGCLAWNIGIGLLPSARGRGVGSLAQRLLVEHLFATTSYDRIEADTDVENIAEQKALAKAGLRREGVIRGAHTRGGVRRDMVLFGILRTDLVEPGGSA
ncbi:GNAT family N-acetyltransferase [Kutzneria sp. CA-103260]|uniref:GNAT family N-acetyltransferase n=1 Tax=Kutzneria sp. CA-103260 TaxID=2802641 RepID=UPI001BA7779C|nr:GNAT family N-acetyltransferase [Kutzneria sp. CA-103260]QUQ70708.1 Acetyltransferase (GNAT) domain protein [Kutzneria sp. CA-103260]